MLSGAMERLRTLLPCHKVGGLLMNDDKGQAKKKKRTALKAPVQMIVTHEFVGTKTVTDAFIPIIYEDIYKTVSEADTLDIGGGAA